MKPLMPTKVPVAPVPTPGEVGVAVFGELDGLDRRGLKTSFFEGKARVRTSLERFRFCGESLQGRPGATSRRDRAAPGNRAQGRFR
jgi:hypothetical protein